jgi:hypothetical protein
MSNDPNTAQSANDSNSTIWLWVIIGGALVLLLSWFVRFPWG